MFQKKEIGFFFFLSSELCLFLTANTGRRLLNGKFLVHMMIHFSSHSLVCQSPQRVELLSLFCLRSRMILSKTDSLSSAVTCICL